jgi:hypothetical protein
LAIITGIQDWAKLDLDAILRYRSVRLAGGWKRNGWKVRAVSAHTINSELGALSAFLTRAVRKDWIARNVLEGEQDVAVKVEENLDLFYATFEDPSETELCKPGAEAVLDAAINWQYSAKLLSRHDLIPSTLTPVRNSFLRVVFVWLLLAAVL